MKDYIGKDVLCGNGNYVLLKETMAQFQALNKI